MKIDPSQDPDGEAERHQGWLAHKYTQALGRACRKHQVDALNKLLSTCRMSADPKVVSALQVYEHYRIVAELAEGREERE